MAQNDFGMQPSNQALFSGNLWERICKRQFPKDNRQEFEAWREMYERCTAARQKKLDFLSEKLNKSYKNVSSPVTIYKTQITLKCALGEL